MIGASAILYINGIKKDELYYQLGPDKQHTVFEGELVAILLGLHLAKKRTQAHPMVVQRGQNSCQSYPIPSHPIPSRPQGY
jgi:hypothetical protein